MLNEPDRLLRQHEPIAFRKTQRKSDRPSGCERESMPLLRFHFGQQLLQSALDFDCAQRLEIESLAARADGRKQAARNMRNEEHHAARRRFLQKLQQAVGGVLVQLVRRIDKCNPPAAGACCHAKKTIELAHLVDTNFLHRPAFAVEAALDHEQTGMRTGAYLQGSRIAHRYIKVGRAPVGRAKGEKITSDPIRQRCLAHAWRTSDQPALRRPPCMKHTCHARELFGVADERAVLARMGKAFETVRLGYLDVPRLPWWHS